MTNAMASTRTSQQHFRRLYALCAPALLHCHCSTLSKHHGFPEVREQQRHVGVGGGGRRARQHIIGFDVEMNNVPRVHRSNQQ
jgi:hypothetical protein